MQQDLAHVFVIDQLTVSDRLKKYWLIADHIFAQNSDL